MEITEEELQKKIDEAVEKATTGLKTKNDELLGKLKKEKEDRDALAEAKEKAELEAAEKAGSVEELKKKLDDKYVKDLAKKDELIATKDAQINKFIIDDGITQALTKAGVAPHYMEAASHLIKGKHSKIDIAEVDGRLTAKVGDQPLSDVITAWSLSDEGKHFLAAPNNTGGGAKGANGTGKAGAAQKRSEMSVKDKTAFIREHGKEAFDQLPA